MLKLPLILLVASMSAWGAERSPWQLPEIISRPDLPTLSEDDYQQWQKPFKKSLKWDRWAKPNAPAPGLVVTGDHQHGIFNEIGVGNGDRILSLAGHPTLLPGYALGYLSRSLAMPTTMEVQAKDGERRSVELTTPIGIRDYSVEANVPLASMVIASGIDAATPGAQDLLLAAVSCRSNGELALGALARAEAAGLETGALGAYIAARAALQADRPLDAQCFAKLALDASAEGHNPIHALAFQLLLATGAVPAVEGQARPGYLFRPPFKNETIDSQASRWDEVDAGDSPWQQYHRLGPLPDGMWEQPSRVLGDQRFYDMGSETASLVDNGPMERYASSIAGAGWASFGTLKHNQWAGWLAGPELDDAELRFTYKVRVVYPHALVDPRITVGFHNGADPALADAQTRLRAAQVQSPFYGITITQKNGVFVHRPALGLTAWISDASGFDSKAVSEVRIIAKGDTVEYRLNGHTVGFARRPAGTFRRLIPYIHIHACEVKAEAVRWLDLTIPDPDGTTWRPTRSEQKQP